MKFDDDRTRTIGNDEFQEDFMEEYKEFNNVHDGTQTPIEDVPAADTTAGAASDPEVDELAYIDEQHARRAAYEQQVREKIREEEQVPAKRQKKKKKSRKGLIIAIIAFFVLAAAGSGYAYMKINGPQDIDVDLTQTMNEVDVSGYNGKAKLTEITVKDDAVDEITAQLKNDDQKTAVAAFFASVRYKASPARKLSNGDEIAITAKYSKKLAKAASITVTETETSYTVKGLKEKEETDTDTLADTVKMPQWFRYINQTGDELEITCLILAKAGTSVTLPLDNMYCCAGGAMSEMVDTSGTPNLTYNGTGYYLEDGYESPTGTVSEIDDSHVKYSLQQYGSHFTLTITYTINEDGSLNVESASGSDMQIPTGKYQSISSSEAGQLAGK